MTTSHIIACIEKLRTAGLDPVELAIWRYGPAPVTYYQVRALLDPTWYVRSFGVPDVAHPVPGRLQEVGATIAANDDPTSHLLSQAVQQILDEIAIPMRAAR